MESGGVNEGRLSSDGEGVGHQNFHSLGERQQRTLLLHGYILSITSNAVSNATNDAASLKSWKRIPGPRTLPILGCALQFLPGGPLHKLTGYNFSEYLFNNYGSIVRVEGLFGTPPFILLFDPEDMAQVLRSENWTPERPGFDSLEYFRKKYRNSDPEKSTGLLTEHGDKWKSFRSAVNPVMLQPKIIKLYNTSLDEVAMDMIESSRVGCVRPLSLFYSDESADEVEKRSLVPRSRSHARLRRNATMSHAFSMRSLRNNQNMISEPFDVEMNKWALESIGVVALGGRIGCLRTDLPPDSPARRLIQCVHDIFRIADELDFKPSLWRFITTSNFKRAMKVYQEQIDLSKHFIQQARKQIDEKKITGTEEKGVLEKLLEVDETTAVIMATDTLFAGVDTAANTIIATLYLLAINPDKQAKLREEILSKDERRPYLKACIKESMRLLPIVSGNLRRATKDYNIKGYLIPKGLNVVMNHEFISKQESQYDRPKEYIPERWIHKSEESVNSRAHPMATSPFGFGTRSCIGRRIAELEMETFLARIIEHFHVEWFGPPLKQETRSITYMGSPHLPRSSYISFGLDKPSKNDIEATERSCLLILFAIDRLHLLIVGRLRHVFVSSSTNIPTPAKDV
ncbi:Cytochrome P450 CYP12A2 [Eumeta japonica]|uniref:Cytochrome P450 CYP12A2 n=1 Tax=Eumeta variegata TaxID=151549 RepID=A0A4C1XS72_EUMVA|nr:Cytochrome P450 CYP12A2 [Eumeta japonica]